MYILRDCSATRGLPWTTAATVPGDGRWSRLAGTASAAHPRHRVVLTCREQEYHSIIISQIPTLKNSVGKQTVCQYLFVGQGNGVIATLKEELGSLCTHLTQHLGKRLQTVVVIPLCVRTLTNKHSIGVHSITCHVGGHFLVTSLLGHDGQVDAPPFFSLQRHIVGHRWPRHERNCESSQGGVRMSACCYLYSCYDKRGSRLGSAAR